MSDMKTKNRTWLYPLIVIGLVNILANSCKKEEEIITDVEGNVYTSVTIGTQVWMVENLKTTKYSNGDLIGTTDPATLDISAEAAPKYQWAYNGNESNVNTYGRLYTWYAVTDTRNVCPTGWHVPTDEEWTILTTYLGGEDIAGGKLKEIGTTHWSTPNTGATNETGFTALPSGNRSSDAYYHAGESDCLWSSTEAFQAFTYTRSMYCYSSNIARYSESKQYGFSVRCLRD